MQRRVAARQRQRRARRPRAGRPGGPRRTGPPTSTTAALATAPGASAELRVNPRAPACGRRPSGRPRRASAPSKATAPACPALGRAERLEDLLGPARSPPGSAGTARSGAATWAGWIAHLPSKPKLPRPAGTGAELRVWPGCPRYGPSIACRPWARAAISRRSRIPSQRVQVGGPRLRASSEAARSA